MSTPINNNILPTPVYSGGFASPNKSTAVQTSTPAKTTAPLVVRSPDVPGHLTPGTTGGYDFAPQVSNTAPGNAGGYNTQPKTNGLLDIHNSLISNLGTTGGTHTTTDPMGNASTVKIPTPEPIASSDTNSQSSSSQGTTAPITGNTTTPSGANVNATTGQLNSAPNTTTFPGLVGSTVSSAQGNIPIGQNATDIANKYTGMINPIVRGSVGQQTGDRTTGTTPVGEGNAAVAAGAAGNLISGLTSQENQELAANSQKLTAQNAQTSGLQGATSAVAPQSGASYFGDPLTGGLVGGSGATGLLGGASTGNSLVDTSVSNALDQIKNGASTTDAMSTLVGGAPAQQAFLNAMKQYDPNWSITSSNAIASQNMAQGQKAQQQAFDMDTALKQIDTIAPNVTSFLQSSGLNSTNNPDVNASLNTYYGKFLNPANKAIFEQYIGDIKKYTGQILAAGSGSIPTDVSTTLSSFDPTNLTAKQLGSYLENLHNLGSNQLSVLQAQTNASYGNGSSAAYSGSPATATQKPVIAEGTPQSQNPTNNKVIQAMIGTADNLLGGLFGTVKGLASHILQ